MTLRAVDVEPDQDLSDVALRAQRGDRDATDALLERVRRLAHRYCRARLASYPAGAHLADDVAQDVCIAVLSALPRYKHRGRPFEAFVHGIASRKVADAQRSVARADRPTDDMPDEVDARPTPEEHALNAADLRQAMILLEELPVKLREVVVLRVAAGMSTDETARALSMTVGAVRVAQHRALTRLRAMAANSQGGRHE
ncbi:MAG: RNA polymerase sigma factor ShbA [Nocardioidaceae bacterium]